MSLALRCLQYPIWSLARPSPRIASTLCLSYYQTTRSHSAETLSDERQNNVSHDAQEDSNSPEPRVRIQKVASAKYLTESYPRVTRQDGVIDYGRFRECYQDLRRGDTLKKGVTVRGRIWSFRIAGSKLAFLDLFQNNRIVKQNTHRLQCLINYENISGSGLDASMFKEFLGSLHRGDVFSIKGFPHRTMRNELSLLATELPQLLSRCRHPLPDSIKDQETLARNKHVDILLHPRPADIIHLRSEIINFIRRYLSDDGHIEVQTPILADRAGGAVARTFQTSSTEFPERRLALRIAPELWLKRLILGGFEKVFEIGPSFRNEGIDLNHNPEFTTCEFYKTYANLEELINMTESMFLRLSRIVDALLHTTCRSLHPRTTDFSPPYRRLDFIPAIEAQLGRKLPILTAPEAQSMLLQLFSEKRIPLPTLPSVPRLLDKLSSRYLETQCDAPTWIINHPECLSPLSKSFEHPDNKQRVAARAELFVHGQEFVNTYEEENSPIEQRKKFEEQLLHHQDDSMGVDEDYLQALEWGLPPTGGWGCGIDRLCMLFSGSSRIADVLPFGTLRNIVSQAQPGKRP